MASIYGPYSKPFGLKPEEESDYGSSSRMIV